MNVSQSGGGLFYRIYTHLIKSSKSTLTNNNRRIRLIYAIEVAFMLARKDMYITTP